MKYTSSIQLIRILKNKTIKAIFLKQHDKVVLLLRKAAFIFRNGDSHTKTMVSNSFILPVTLTIEMDHHCRSQYIQLFPAQLKAAYLGQIYSSGI